jgi:hypothetical protein
VGVRCKRSVSGRRAVGVATMGVGRWSDGVSVDWAWVKRCRVHSPSFSTPGRPACPGASRSHSRVSSCRLMPRPITVSPIRRFSVACLAARISAICSVSASCSAAHRLRHSLRTSTPTGVAAAALVAARLPASATSASMSLGASRRAACSARFAFSSASRMVITLAAACFTRSGDAKRLKCSGEAGRGLARGRGVVMRVSQGSDAAFRDVAGREGERLL